MYECVSIDYEAVNYFRYIQTCQLQVPGLNLSNESAMFSEVQFSQ